MSLGRPRLKMDPNRQVDLLKAYEIIHESLTTALCEEVFQSIRRGERQRRDKWTLEALAEFWIAVTLDPPVALRTALAQALQKPEEVLFPRVEAVPSSFFERCQNLRPDFFAGLFDRFVPPESRTGSFMSVYSAAESVVTAHRGRLRSSKRSNSVSEGASPGALAGDAATGADTRSSRRFCTFERPRGCPESSTVPARRTPAD